MDNQILIVDDDKKISRLIDFRLKKQGFRTHCAFDGREAIDYVNCHEPVLVLLDIRLPDLGGVEVLKALLKRHPKTHVIMISAHADVKVAVECMKLGAYDFIEKPFAFPELDAKVSHIFDQLHLEEEITTLKKELGEKYQFKSLVGKSTAMKKVFEAIEMATQSDANVLIEGESGTGKELVARAIHFNGNQKQGPFIAVNCGAIPENLLESELFGHEKGSFTGALARKIGKFEQAQNGSIFLDEIGDLSATLQVKLLRVLQEREIERVGGNETIPLHARFIAASHQDLKKLVKEEKFREDLYFRVNVFPIRIPPLRERKEDIPELFRYFLERHRGRKNGKIQADVLGRLAAYDWPGNVRELENVVERLVLIKGKGDSLLTEADIESLEVLNPPEAQTAAEAGHDREKVVGDAERAFLEKTLQEAQGNITRACKVLHMSRDTFYRKMKKYSILR